MNSIKLLDNEVAFEQGATLNVQFYVGKTPTAPTSATLSLYHPNGTLVIDAEDMTVAGTLLTYDATSDDFSDKLENYRVHVSYVYQTVTYAANFLVDVVLTPLINSISDTDLEQKHPNLADDLWTSTSDYSIQIGDAFDEVKKDIKNKGNRADMLIDSKQIEKLIEYKALELIFFDFAENNEGINWMRYLRYKEKYDIEFLNLRIVYDADRDGVIDSEESFSTLRLVR